MDRNRLIMTFILATSISQILMAAEPEITSTAILSVDQNSAYDYLLTASDEDHDRLHWSFKPGYPNPAWLSLQPTAHVTTIAGSGEQGSEDSDDPLQASFNNIWGIAIDHNQVFITEYTGYRLRQIEQPELEVFTVAGNGELGDEDHPEGLLASFGHIRHIAAGEHRDIYLTGHSNHKIRKFEQHTGAVTTVAGSGVAGDQDHQDPLQAQFSQPYGIAVDQHGNIFFSANHKIKRIDADTGAVSTLAGNGDSAWVDHVNPHQASFGEPTGLSIDPHDNIYVTDGNSIRKIDGTTRAVTTIAGSTESGAVDHPDPSLARFNRALAITHNSSGNLLVVDFNNHKIRHIDTQTQAVTTYAGLGTPGAQDHIDGALAQFNSPTAIDTDSQDNIWVTDWHNHKVRKLKPTMRLIGTPDNDDVGQHPVCLILTDGEHLVEHCFSITVNDVNDPPQISGQPPRSVNEDNDYQFQPTASDVDIADQLSFSIENQPSWTTFDHSSGKLSGTPGNDDVGTTTNIKISVSDGQATASLAPFNLTVLNLNDPPTISGEPPIRVFERNFYHFAPIANDIDLGDRLTFSISGQPSWLSFSPITGVLSGTPTRLDVGTHENIIISVSDGVIQVSLPAFTIEVIVVNTPPVITPRQSFYGQEDTSLQFSIDVSDAQGDSLSYSISTMPEHGNISMNNNIVHYTPDTDFYGNDSFTLIAFDGVDHSQPEEVTIQITPVDDIEVVINDTYQLSNITAGTVITLDVLNNDNANDQLELLSAFSLDAEVAINQGQIQLTTPDFAVPELTINYVAQDGQGKYHSAQVVVIFD